MLEARMYAHVYSVVYVCVCVCMAEMTAGDCMLLETTVWERDSCAVLRVQQRDGGGMEGGTVGRWRARFETRGDKVERS